MKLAEAIRTGSGSYHRLYPGDHWYRNYMAVAPRGPWEGPTAFGPTEVEKLSRFLNQWRSHFQGTRDQLSTAIQEVLPLLNSLADETLLDVDLSGIQDRIARAFNIVAKCGPENRNQATATSKVLATMCPKLFVMWDTYIRCGFGIPISDGDNYARKFLPRMQRIGRLAVAERMSAKGSERREAIGYLCHECGEPLAKVVDEWAFAKFTLRRDEVWDVELS